MNQLNPQQQQAVQHLGSPLLVLAGAGSGKTRVITQKIAWLINERAIDPIDITAVTFTNKAAKEMKQRVQQMFEKTDRAQGLTVTTFHSLGMKILKKQLKDTELRSGFSIVDPRDVTTILSDLLRAVTTENKEFVERVARRVSHWKNLNISPEQAKNHIEDPIGKAALSIYSDYQRYLRACNCVDLDDLLFLPVQLFEQNSEIKRYWQLQIRYLLVDEYQDTNAVQYQLVRQLSAEGRRLVIVGDDDQSIYAWRGAQPQNLSQLGKDFPDLTVIKLEQNYRSSGRILKVANSLIMHNVRSFEKNLWSELGYGEPIQVLSAKNENHESEKIVSAIMRQQFRHNTRFGDFAILYRSNHQARAIEIKLREMRIPYRISGGSSFFDRSEIRDILAYLRLISNTLDDSAFLRIINTPRRGIGTTSLEKLANIANKNRQSLYETSSNTELKVVLKSRQMHALTDFITLITQLHLYTESGNVVEVIQALLDHIEYKRWLHETCEVTVAEKRWENVNILIKWLSSTQLGKETNQSLTELINELILNDLLDQQKDDNNENEVNLTTLHASKGLEYPHVFIIGVEEDILPHRVSVAEGSDEEERRLFYVGITRAMNSLTLSYAEKRKRFGELIQCEPSRFLAELPADEITWDKVDEKDPSEIQDTGRAHLASIRALRKRHLSV